MCSRLLLFDLAGGIAALESSDVSRGDRRGGSSETLSSTNRDTKLLATARDIGVLAPARTLER